MTRFSDVWRNIKSDQSNYYIIHYSSENLYGDENSGLSPRITSIVVMHVSTNQQKSFAIHTIAAEISIQKEDIINKFDLVERRLLEKFYKFVKEEQKNRSWIHWNMRNITYGFEHIEHRFQVLSGAHPPAIPVDKRINLNDLFKEIYGENYAKNPRMKNLMVLNGPVDDKFLDGPAEAQAFKSGDYIRMHSSTLAKVGFFHYAIMAAIKGKLKTEGRSIGARIDRLLESRSSRILALCSAIVGIPGSVWFLLVLIS